MHYMKHFMGPVPALAPLMVPIELISHLARPLSLTLRLFGNMVGGHILLAIIFFLMGLNGLIGWALSGSAAGAIVGGLGSVIMIVFTVGFLYPAEAAGRAAPGLHLRHADDALHRRRHRGGRAPGASRTTRLGSSLVIHTYRRLSCDGH